MLIEDDAPRPSRSFTPAPLDRLGVEELHAYIRTLRAEIARAEAEIARKEGLRTAADDVFRRR